MRHLARPLSLVLLLLVLFAQALPASASNTWSDTDPVVVISTPGGHLVPVYVNNGVDGAQHLPAAQVARMSYTAKSVQSGDATKVTVTSNVPCDALGSGWATRTRPSTGAFGTGTLYGEAYGVCGQDLTVTFTLPVP
jgi:hypothetical protein